VFGDQAILAVDCASETVLHRHQTKKDLLWRIAYTVLRVAAAVVVWFLQNSCKSVNDLKQDPAVDPADGTVIQPLRRGPLDRVHAVIIRIYWHDSIVLVALCYRIRKGQCETGCSL